MDLPALLGRELRGGRRRFLGLLVVLVVVPGMMAYGTVVFETVLPTDTPVGVVGQTDAVTDDDIAITRAAVTFFSDPTTYDSRSAAFRALDRERVYAVVAVPANITGAGEHTFDLFVHGSVVPYHQPSELITNVMNVYLQDATDSQVTVERHIVGDERSLAEYLLPAFMLTLTYVLALAYFPYHLVAERPVVERLRVESSLTAVVASKLLFSAALLALPVLVFAGVAAVLGYDVAAASPGVALVLGLTFLALAAFAAAVTLVTRFTALGRVLNILLLLFLFVFSGLLYPVGFFSTARRELVRLVPVHYSAVMVRGFALRDAPLAAYADWLAGLLGLVAVGLLAVRLSVTYYEWGE